MFHLTKSLAHVFLVVMATYQLTSCETENKAGGGEKPDSKPSKHKFDFSQINKDTPIKVGEKFGFKITLKDSDGKLVDDIDNVSVDLHVKCGDSEWEELQSSVKLDKGEFEFSDLTLKEEYAGQDCQLKVAGKIDGEEIESTFAIKAAKMSIAEIDVDAPAACTSPPCVAIADTAKVGELFAITYRAKSKVSANTNITFYLEDEDGTKLPDALWLYDDTDSDNPTLSKQVSAVLKAGQDALSIKVFTVAKTAIKGKVVAEVSGQVVTNKIVVASDGTLAKHDNDLELVEAYLFISPSDNTYANLRLKVGNSNDGDANVFNTRNMDNKLHFSGATTFSSSVATTPMQDTREVPLVSFNDKVIVVTEDGRVAARGVQTMKLHIKLTVTSPPLTQGQGFSVTLTHQTCVYRKSGVDLVHCTKVGGGDAVGQLVTLHMTTGNGKLLKWDNVGAIAAKLNSSFQVSFNNLFFTTEGVKQIKASMLVYGRKVSSDLQRFNLGTGEAIIAQVVWDAGDGFTFKSQTMEEGESFEYYFVKLDGTKSDGQNNGNNYSESFTSHVVDGYRLAYLAPGEGGYNKLNLATTCYEKMLVKAGNDYQLITQDIGACARPSP